MGSLLRTFPLSNQGSATRYDSQGFLWQKEVSSNDMDSLHIVNLSKQYDTEQY